MPVRRVLTGFAVLAAAMFVTQAVGFVALAVASRRLGPADLGAATFALNLALYFAIPANFGLSLLGIRDVAREPERAREITGEILGLRILLSVVTFVALITLAPLIAAGHRSQVLIPLAALAIPVDAITGEWTLLGAQRPVAAAVGRLAGQVVYGALVLIFLTGGLHGARLFVAYTVLSILITAVLTSLLAARALGRPAITFKPSRLRIRAAASVPLGVAAVMVQIYISVGAIMLAYIDGAAAVGQFTVAQKLPLALLGVTQLWSATLYPQAARLMADHREELRAQITLFMRLSLALALPVAIGAALVGPDLIPTLFGAAYGPAGHAFVWIAAALALSMLTVNVSSVLAAGGDERRYATGRVIGAIAAVTLNALAIPALGIDGAGLTLLLAEATVLVYMTARYRRVVGPISIDPRATARVALASAAMAAALIATGGVEVLARVAIGIAVYAIAAVVLGVVRRDELRSALRRG